MIKLTKSTYQAGDRVYFEWQGCTRMGSVIFDANMMSAGWKSPAGNLKPNEVFVMSPAFAQVSSSCRFPLPRAALWLVQDSVPAPQSLTFAEFRRACVILPLRDHSRRAEVIYPGLSARFVDALGDEGLRQAHRNFINNALVLFDLPSVDFDEPLPSVEALREYPDLMERYPDLTALILRHQHTSPVPWTFAKTV